MRAVAPDARSLLPARILALGGLLLVCAALLSILSGRGPAEPATAASPEGQLTRLAAASESVSRELEALRRGRSAQPARRAIKAAMAEGERTGRAGYGDERLSNALDAQTEYLDALGSVLSNPNSTLRGELAGRGRRLRAAFASLPSGERLAASVRGWQRALARTRR